MEAKPQMPAPVRAGQDSQNSLWGKLGGGTRPRLLHELSSRLFSNVTFYPGWKNILSHLHTAFSYGRCPYLALNLFVSVMGLP